MNIRFKPTLCLLAFFLPASATLLADDMRVRDGLQVLFDFRSSKFSRIVDTAGMNRPIGLKIETPKTVQLQPGFIEFRGKSMVRSETRADRIHRACTWTNELTVETWIQPADTKQSGPARIISFSRDGSQRNFTLGQDGNKFDFRLRTNRTSANGIPSVSTPSGAVTTKLTHVVYTRAQNGAARIYVNGKKVAEQNVPGEFSNWDINFRLLIGNEQSGDRVWKGKMHLVAIFNRALFESEVRRNFEAGVDGKTPKLVSENQVDLFKSSVAPILALRCLECHDSFNREGGLDLSQKLTALKGGDSGPVIQQGKADKSLLWESVESDEMPQDRPPLKPAEKLVLKKWIEDGANWTVDRVDPAVFLRSREVDERLLRRLTVQEYVESVKTAVGVDIAKRARELLPKDIRADGFSNTAYNLNVDLKHIQIFAKLADEIARKIDVRKFVEQFNFKKIGSKKISEKELRDLISNMGRWVLRGPLNEVELVSILNVAQAARNNGGSIEQAVRGSLQAMLQSPRFLYQIEHQRGDGTRWPVDAFTRANRMSFIVWGSPPDRELFKLANNGQLNDPAVYAKQIERLLKDPKAKKRSEEFVTEWLHLDRLISMKPDEKKFPDWNRSLASQMREETVRFWDEIVWNQNKPLNSLFDADVSFVTPELARHYGMIGRGQGINEDELKPGWNRVDLNKVPGRRGILTQGSVLTVGGDEASMVARGLFILDDVLRGVINDPPACVNTTPQPTRPGQSQRFIALGRIKNDNCGGCHKKFEPLAFGFEKFDGLGSWRPVDKHGNKLREDGEIRFPGTSNVSNFKTSKELASLVAKSDRALETLVWKLVQFSMGRPLGPGDIDAISAIHKKSKSNGGTYPSVIRAILTSNLVLKIKTEPYPKEP